MSPFELVVDGVLPGAPRVSGDEPPMPGMYSPSSSAPRVSGDEPLRI